MTLQARAFHEQREGVLAQEGGEAVPGETFGGVGVGVGGRGVCALPASARRIGKLIAQKGEQHGQVTRVPVKLVPDHCVDVDLKRHGEDDEL